MCAFAQWRGKNLLQGLLHPLHMALVDVIIIMHSFLLSWHLDSEFFKHSILGNDLPQWRSLQRICLQCRRHRFNPWVWKIPWRRTWHPFQYSCLKNPIDKGTWQATVLRVAKCQTQPSNGIYTQVVTINWSCYVDESFLPFLISV